MSVYENQQKFICVGHLYGHLKNWLMKNKGDAEKCFSERI